jgi:hypothetical protein
MRGIAGTREQYQSTPVAAPIDDLDLHVIAYVDESRRGFRRNNELSHQ